MDYPRFFPAGVYRLRYSSTSSAQVPYAPGRPLLLPRSNSPSSLPYRKGQGSTHFTAPPLQTEPAALGFG